MKKNKTNPVPARSYRSSAYGLPHGKRVAVSCMVCGRGFTVNTEDVPGLCPACGNGTLTAGIGTVAEGAGSGTSKEKEESL
jgi:hypothetical protein